MIVRTGGALRTVAAACRSPAPYDTDSPAARWGGSVNIHAAVAASSIVPALRKIVSRSPIASATGPPASVAITSPTASIAAPRPAMRSNSRSRPSCFSESYSSALSAPDVNVIATAQTKYESRISGSVDARPNARIASAVVSAPRINDVRRPQRSATAPVGTSDSATASQNGASISVTSPRLRPRSSSRYATQIGSSSHISESSLNT